MDPHFDYMSDESDTITGFEELIILSTSLAILHGSLSQLEELLLTHLFQPWRQNPDLAQVWNCIRLSKDLGSRISQHNPSLP